MLQKKIFEEGNSFYDVWMHHANEMIQDTALAFGERFFLQNALDQMDKLSHPGAKNLLRQAIYLTMYTLVYENMTFYLLNGLVSKEAA